MPKLTARSAALNGPLDKATCAHCGLKGTTTEIKAHLTDDLRCPLRAQPIVTAASHCSDESHDPEPEL